MYENTASGCKIYNVHSLTDDETFIIKMFLYEKIIYNTVSV